MASEQWTSVALGLPEAEKDVLVVISNYGVSRIEVASHWSLQDRPPHEWYSYEQPERPIEFVTHWMPLPAMPQ